MCFKAFLNKRKKREEEKELVGKFHAYFGFLPIHPGPSTENYKGIMVSAIEGRSISEIKEMVWLAGYFYFPLTEWLGF